MANFTDTFNAGSSNNILEAIESPADGRSVTVSSGTYALETVSGVQALTNSYANVNGSKITYTPPSGTKYIYYNFEFKVRPGSSNYCGLTHYRIYVGGSDVTEAFRTYSGNYYSNYGYNTHMFEIGYVFDLTASSDNVAAGQWSTWTGSKEIVVKARRYSNSYVTSLHGNTWFDGAGATGNRLWTRPHLTLIALS